MTATTISSNTFTPREEESSRNYSHPYKSCLKPMSDKVSGEFKVSHGNSKKVFFDEILIKEYPVILGDNPAV